jgi:CPA1 family monovalent cation:H+ antiporter
MLAWISVLVAVAAVFGWVSAKVLRLPNTIGTMLLTAATSMALVFFDPILPGPHLAVMRMMVRVDFARLFLHGMLGVLLFAGSFLLDLKGLRQQRLPVALLSVVSTVISVLLVGAGTYGAARMFGFRSTWLECLLFGALISPTDPIAVLEMLHRVRAPKHLEAQLAGESLFNDGVGAVIFIALLGAVTSGMSPRPMMVAARIVLTGGGGMLLGAGLAVPVALLMRSVKNTAVDLLLSVALALGGYAIADRVGLSGPLASVVSALVLRWLVERIPGEEVAHAELNHMWTTVDEIDCVPAAGGGAGVERGGGGECGAGGERGAGAGDRAVFAVRGADVADGAELGRAAGRVVDRAGAVDPGGVWRGMDCDVDVCAGGVFDPGAGRDDGDGVAAGGGREEGSG